MSDALEKLNTSIAETAKSAVEAGLSSLQMMVEISGAQYHVEFKMELAAEYLSRIAPKLDSIGE